mmetsp:Transcript_60967/g.143562  ORF Transcript_60967/g.143562 Transcript_60967/m.143562 type:complete len:275 (-) Transcript_60967:1080-1904(-)
MHVLLGDCNAFGLAQWSHSHADLVDVGHVPDVGHLTRIEDIVDVFEERLHNDLRVAEQEHSLDPILARAQQSFLHILTPLRLPVTFRDLDLETAHVGGVGSEPRKALPSTAADAEQKCVALGLAQNAADPADVFNSVEEHHELHRLVRLLIVLLQVPFDRLPQNSLVLNLAVETRIRVRDHVVPKQDAVCRHHCVPILLEMRREHLFQEIVKPFAIWVVCQAILEDPCAFMRPQPHNNEGLLSNLLGIRHHHALENLSEIAQVESVVRFRRSWQ